MRLKLIVPGEPVPQGRPRFNRYTGKAYDPEKSRKYKALVKRMAKKVAPQTPVTCPVGMTILIFRSIPKSFTKKQHAAIENDKLRPITKPDVSNVVKGIEDALNGVWYADDSQIIFSFSAKQYSSEPRVEIRMETWEENKKYEI